MLLIEDDRNEAAAIEKACCPDPTVVAFRVANHAAAGEDALRSHEFDLVICDLALPPDQRRIDPDTDQGRRLFRLIRDEHQGTPIIILSAHADLHMMQEFFEAVRDGDLYGTRTDQALVEFFPKEKLDQCVESVRSHIARTVQLDQLAIEAPDDLDLRLSDQRALRIYGRRIGAAKAIAAPLDGGLSDAKTLRVAYTDDRGAPTGTVVAKLGPLRGVVQEAERYDQVAGLLPPGLGASLIFVVRAGSGRRGALIYQMADEASQSLFGLLAAGDATAVEACRQLSTRLRKWGEDVPPGVRALVEIRRGLVSDLDLGESGAVTHDERDIEVLVRESMSHGDLHGLNVLVAPQGQPTLIDYGDVRRDAASLDPITLELSVLYHPAMAGRLDGWPSIEQARQWHDLDIYCAGSPVEEFIRVCREWAGAVCADESEMLATAYAYSMRQMKYGEATTMTLAAAVAEGAFSRLVT